MFVYTNSKGVRYHLNQKKGRNGTGYLYYFTREQKDTSVAMPDGYAVSELKSGLPILKKVVVA